MENYLLLCRNCHGKIDKVPEEFPVETLRAWRESHITWVDEELQASLTRVTFAELESVTDAIASAASLATSDFQLTPPDAKMDRNGLTQRLRRVIALSLSQAGQVRDFLMEFEETAPDFPEKLIGGFRKRYYEARARGLTGDDLYNHLATHESSDLALQTAQGMVVAYLFHTCDLFES